MKDEINYKFNYVGCKHWRTLDIIKWGNTYYRNWFHHTCQNEYNYSNYLN